MKKLLFGLSFLLVFCFVFSCFAADDFTVSDYDFVEAEKSFRFLISDNRDSGLSPNAVSVSVDGSDLTNVGLKSLTDSDVPVTFVFVVDNTSTAYADQKNRPAEIAEAISSSRSGKNDEYYLISFDKEVHAPVGPSKYPADVLDKLTYNVPGLSDYSEALHKAVELLNGETGFGKKVIILIADGSQVASPRLQQGELIEELSSAGYPIYTCGLLRSESQKYEEADLKKLSTISQRTGGLSFSYDTNNTPGKEILRHIEKSLVVTGDLAEAYTREDAGQGDVLIRLMRGTTEQSSVGTKVLLPQILPTGEPSNETEDTPDPEQPIETPDVPVDPCADPANPNCPTPSFFDKIRNQLQNVFGDNWLLAVIACCLLAALIILVIVLITKKNKGEVFEEVDPIPQPEKKEEEKSNKDEKTDIIGPDQPEPVKPSVKIVLDNLTTRKRVSGTIAEGDSKVFGRLDKKNPDNGVVVISADDTFISRNQFMITVSGGRCLIKDLGTKNGTYLNGEKITGEVVVQNGSKIRIGDIPGEREFMIMISKS